MKRLRDSWSAPGVGALLVALWACVMLGVILAGATTGFWLVKRYPPPVVKMRYVQVNSHSAYETLTKEQADQCEAEGGALVRGARPDQVYCFPPRTTETAQPDSPNLEATGDPQVSKAE